MNTKSQSYGKTLPFHHNTNSSHLSTKIQIVSGILKHKYYLSLLQILLYYRPSPLKENLVPRFIILEVEENWETRYEGTLHVPKLLPRGYGLSIEP